MKTRFRTEEEANEFNDYIEPIRGLEKAFRDAGVNIEFTLTVWKEIETCREGKAVVINYHAPYGNSISIQGDSPAQAVKNIAAAVSLREREVAA